MKELTLKEIQQESLKILVDVDHFCKSHNIDYSLAYGTLIGAIRHQGFIPWDDDIDIIMTRTCFERFIKEYESRKGYKLVSPYDKNSYIAFARVCDIEKTLIVSRTPWSNYTTGIWIDIFPIDSIDDNESEHKMRWKRLNRTWRITAIARGAKANPFSNEHWHKPNYLIWLKKVLFFNGVFVRKAIECYIKSINDPKYYHSGHVAQLACCDEYGFYDKNDFYSFTSVRFEGFTLKAIEKYDKVLRQLYGNYMQLPPLSAQQPKQSDYIRFYWRTN